MSARVALEAVDAVVAALARYDNDAAAVDVRVGMEVSGAVARLEAQRARLHEQTRQAAARTVSASGSLGGAQNRLANASPDRDTWAEQREVDRCAHALETARREQAQAERKAEDADRVLAGVAAAVSVWEGHRSNWRAQRSTIIPRAARRLALAGADLAQYSGASRVGASQFQGSSGAASGEHSRRPSAPATGGSASVTRLDCLPADIALVSLSSVDVGDSMVHGTGDFTRGDSASDLSWAVEKFFDVVLPTLQQGGTRADLADRDSSSGQTGVRSLAGTYDGFLGNQAPVLSARPDGSFEVVNGYHRIWCAQQLGFDSIPARLT